MHEHSEHHHNDSGHDDRGAVTPPSLDAHKTALRRDVRLRLKSMNTARRHTASVEISRRIVSLECFRNAWVVMLYMPLATEVDVTSVAVRAFQEGKTVCVPRVDWDRKEIYPVEVQTFDDRVMDLDEHGVRVPREGRLVIPDMIDLIILPGLAFDVAGHRLGRGGGYYDRFLARLPRTTVRAAAAFEAQIVDKVPTNDLDARVDFVITERRINRNGKPSIVG